jgi:hypothetical protein
MRACHFFGPLIASWAVLLLPIAAFAQTTPVLTIHTLDAADGGPLDDVKLTIDGRALATDKLGPGAFRLNGLMPGRHRIVGRAAGHDDVTQEISAINADQTVTLRLPRTEDASALHVIGRSAASMTSNGGLTVHTTLGSTALVDAGTFRLADALVTLPSLNATATGMTSQQSGPGSSIYLDLRGYGAIETSTLIDGHPIGQGIDLGFNFQNAPIFALDNVYIGYGTGASGLDAIGAIGGIIDMRTLVPTKTPVTSLLQGVGSDGRATTAATATGSTPNGKFGYAFAYGIDGNNGPLGTQTIYSPAASWDPSSRAPAIVGPATYALSQGTNRRAILGRLSFALSPTTQLSLRAVSNNSYSDGTGNSDDLLLPSRTALAQGNQLLANKAPTDACPAGTFTATNAYGIPQGSGRNFAPDGGVTCQTAAQYAAFNTGFAGYGPHFVTERATDYDARLSSTYGRLDVVLDAFTNSYHFDYDRLTFQPYFAAPGDTGFSSDQLVVNTGVSLVSRLAAGDHDVGFEYRNLLNTNRFRVTGSPVAAPVIANSTYALEDVVHHAGSRFTAQVGAAFAQSTATNTSSVDPHAAFVLTASPRDTVRLTGGFATVQPPGAWLDTPFIPVTSLSPVCSEPTSIGNVASATLKPEHGSDADVTYSHRWDTRDETVIGVYTGFISNKIYNATVPLNQLPAGAYDSAVAANFQQQLDAACGPRNAGLGATGYVNLGTVQTRGIQIAGRRHLTPQLALTYGWSQESAILRSVDPSVLQANLTLVPGGQLPAVPVHKATLGFQYRAANGIAAALTQTFVSTNNPSNLPAYSFGNLSISGPIAGGRLNVAVANVFNQYAGDVSLLGAGQALALNAFAPASAYAALTGAAATTYNPLAPRQIDVFYTIRR